MYQQFICTFIMFKEKDWPSAYLIKFSYLYILMIPIYIKAHITQAQVTGTIYIYRQLSKRHSIIGKLVYCFIRNSQSYAS